MSLGQVAKLYVPYQLAYGENGAQPFIPPKCDLEYRVELLKIRKPKKCNIL